MFGTSKYNITVSNIMHMQSLRVELSTGTSTPVVACDFWTRLILDDDSYDDPLLDLCAHCGSLFDVDL